MIVVLVNHNLYLLLGTHERKLRAATAAYPNIAVNHPQCVLALSLQTHCMQSHFNTCKKHISGGIAGDCNQFVHQQEQDWHNQMFETALTSKTERCHVSEFQFVQQSIVLDPRS